MYRRLLSIQRHGGVPVFGLRTRRCMGDIVHAQQALYFPFRNPPSGMGSAGAQLMVQTCMVRQSGAGFFDMLPLGLRSMQRVVRVIDEELAAIGCSKLALPLLTPAELWAQTGRLDAAGPGVFRVRDRKEAEFVVAPTHEEAVTSLAASLLNAGCPAGLRLYQIGPKFRDEARPRAGLLRGREFVMKDLYSFDVDRERALSTYEQVAATYRRIFDRLGLETVQAEADPGDIGGGDLNGRPTSHEFHLPADVGDDTLLRCEQCRYAANTEAATFVPPAAEVEAAHLLLVTHGHDPLALLRSQTSGDGGGDGGGGVLAWRRSGGGPDSGERWVPVVPQRRAANPLALRTAVGAPAVEPERDAGAVQRAAAAGRLRLVLDRSLGGTHALGQAQAGDACPHCRAPLRSLRGIEIGHVFYLGTRYSAPLQCLVRNAAARVPAEMGCYGIGVSRILAAVAEARHDAAGLCWPAPLAPVHAVVVGARDRTQDTQRAAEALARAGADVLVDDRDLGPGARLRDARLLGAPLAVVVAREMSASGRVEVHVRRPGDGGTAPPQLVGVEALAGVVGPVLGAG